MSDTAAFSYPFATLQQLAEDVLKHASAKGATACEVDVSEGFGQSVTVRCDEVETIEFNRDKGIGITIYSGQRKGYASTSDFSAQALRETVEAALDIARFTAEDDCAGLAEAALMARDCPDLDLYHPWALTVEDAIETARLLLLSTGPNHPNGLGNNREMFSILAAPACAHQANTV